MVEFIIKKAPDGTYVMKGEYLWCDKTGWARPKTTIGNYNSIQTLIVSLKLKLYTDRRAVTGEAYRIVPVRKRRKPKEGKK